ncbi:C40 family peptidase [Flavobacterium sp.]|uniref:C40 family peptidase n=1 Tax=Flavobacterium sp. TaxID=239 RepID=UPI00286EACDD|nr:C40 family peptidase [Flavobacterium sp.]
MAFKIFFVGVFLGLFFTSCKTASSSIVTSKQEAEKLGIYKAPRKITSKEIPKVTETKTETVKSKIKETEDYDYIASSGSHNYVAEQIVNKGLLFQGVPYRSGGTTTSGMDCSGFIIASFTDYNVPLPRTSNDMSRTGEEIDRYSARKGDLIFFRTNGSRVINHVGLVIEASGDDIKFVHSSTSRGVIVSTTKESYYGKTFAQVNRVIE